VWFLAEQVKWFTDNFELSFNKDRKLLLITHVYDLYVEDTKNVVDMNTFGKAAKQAISGVETSEKSIEYRVLCAKIVVSLFIIHLFIC